MGKAFPGESTVWWSSRVCGYTQLLHPPGVEEWGGVGADAAWRREDQAKEWRLDGISISWLSIY